MQSVATQFRAVHQRQCVAKPAGACGPARPPAPLISNNRHGKLVPGQGPTLLRHTSGANWISTSPARREKVVSASTLGTAADSSPPSLGPVLTAVAFACAGAFAFGYNLGVVNGPLEAIAGDLGFLGNKGMEGLVVSSTLLGAALGSLSGGGLSDALGRRVSFLLAAVPMAVGPLLSACAANFEGMVLGRFLAGLAIGLSSTLTPTYISEVAPTNIRGTLGTLNQLMICIGILAALLINVALPVTQWRTMFATAAIPALVLALGMLISPESPRWLASKGREASASAAAVKLWGLAGLAELEGAAPAKGEGGSAPSGGWGEMLTGKAAKPLLIGCLLFVFQQLSGINALVYFSTSVFKQAGVKSTTLASAAVGVTNVLGTLVAVWLMDKAGRKQLLTNSFMGQALAMFVMAAGFSLPALQPYAGTIAVAGTLFYILAFATGAGPVPGLIVPELNPLRTRGRAVAAAFVAHWVANVALGQSFMGAVASYGLPAVYAFFGTVALVGAMYVTQVVPETKGKTLEQIEAELS